MAGDDTVKITAGTLGLVAEAIKVAGQNPDAKAAGAELGKAALTVTRTINNALLPLAAVNFAFDKAREYFAQQFTADLSKKVVSIPSEQIVEPRPSIAGPALQGLAFAHEEPELKEMYLNLLASSMDGRVAHSTHPAFVDVVRQMTSEDAIFVRVFLRAENSSIAQVRAVSSSESSYTVLLNHLLSLCKASDQSPVENRNMCACVDNWIRLGLVTVDYDTHRWAPGAYDWVESRPEFIRLRGQYEAADRIVTYRKGVLQRTAFGEMFARVVGILPSVL